MDGLNDYDEVMLDINPNDSTDSGKVVKQKIDTDDECLSGVNVEGLPYDVSMEIKASGYVASSLKADNSLSYSSTYSFDTIGEIPEFSYDNGNVEEVTLNFEFDEEYIAENEIDFDALNIFKYYDEVNMFIPLKTVRNEDEKILSCESESLGTFCVKDINEWFLNFTDSSSESEENISFLSSDSNIMAKSIYNETILLNSADTEIEPVNVVFAVDRLQFMGMMSVNRPAQIKQNIINVSEQLFKRYKNVKIYLVYYDNASYIEICDNIDSVKESVNGVPFLITQSLSQCIEKPINDVKMLLSNMAPNYYFIYNGTYFNTNPPQDYREQFELNLKQEKSCHMCFVSAGCMLDGDYIDYYANNYEGKVFNLFSETIDDDVLNFIAKESKLQKNSSYVTPGAGDTPSEDEPVNTEPSNRYVISSNLTTVTLDAPLTKNSKVDSDNDGLTDVEELIPNCKLVKWDDDGNIILPSLLEVILEYGRDSDFMHHNRLANPLLKILPVRSNPAKEDTDYDGLSDSEEIFEHNSNPLKYNKIVSIQDVDIITDDMRYSATSLKEQYDGGEFFTEISVFLANNFFGSAHDYKLIYKEALLSYFKDINDYIIEDEKRFNESEYLYNVNICTQIQAVISLALKSSEPFFDNINIDYNYMLKDLENSGKVLDKNLFQYCQGKLSRQNFIDVNNEQIGKVLDNKVFRYYYAHNKIGASVKFINKGMKYFDSLNTFVTCASIVETGIMALNTSLNDMFDVLIYGDVIEKNITTLIHVQYSTNSLFLKEAAQELKDEIENKSLNFFTEITNMSNLFCHNVGDGLVRMEIASCSGAGTLIIAEIALTDMAFSVSGVGLNFLNAYAYTSISESLATYVRAASTKFVINGTVYEHISLGEYLIYNFDESNEYINSVKYVCIARAKGENEILEMEHWNTKKWVSFLGNDTFFENTKYNRDCALNVCKKY